MIRVGTIAGLQHLQKMASSSFIPQVKNVDIDPSGTFKYILIKVTSHNSEGKLEDKLIVRGYGACGFHSNINDKVKKELLALKSSKAIKNWRSNVLGGGRIKHDPKEKSINVYGYSQDYGKADHKLAVDILKTEYPDYNITWSDEGY